MCHLCDYLTSSYKITLDRLPRYKINQPKRYHEGELLGMAMRLIDKGFIDGV